MTNKYSNVDPVEISKFTQIASEWWEPQGKFKPLHQINPCRLQFIQTHSGGLFGKRILDVGCGGGILSEAMAQQGAHVTGLDLAEESLEVARLHALETGLSIEYIQQSVENLSEQPPCYFDIITCMEMLEHVPDPGAIVAACSKLVSNGGLLFFSTINRHICAWFSLILGAEYLLHIVPRGTHQFGKFIQPSELINFIEQAQLEPLHIAGIKYQPITQQAKLSANVDTNYIICARKVQ